MNVAAIILSAGTSRRMGQPKALMKLNGKTFLQQIIDVLSATSISNITVVLGSSAQQICASLSDFCGKIIINEHWQQGQLSSVIAGIDSLGENFVDAIMLCPVDHPLISENVIQELLCAFETTKKKIILPKYCGRRGHPIIFSRDIFSEIRNAPTEIGARSVLHKFPNEICEVQTNEECVLANIDTREDYEKYIANTHNAGF